MFQTSLFQSQMVQSSAAAARVSHFVCDNNVPDWIIQGQNKLRDSRNSETIMHTLVFLWWGILFTQKFLQLIC